MKLLYGFLLFLTGFTFAEKSDSLWVDLAGDTIKIWNAATLNCCSHIKFEAEIQDNHIILTEIDTSLNWCKCLCDFNLTASLPGLKPGSYTTDVYRKYLVQSPYDTLIYIGTIQFKVNAPDTSAPALAETYQSECLSDLTISETAGWTLPKDSLFIEVVNDTVKIWNYNVYTNCCSYFKIETEITEGIIKLIETDTTKNLCNCMCTFNLSASIINLKTGKYKAEVYRTTKYFNKDTILIGSMEFEYPGTRYSQLQIKSYQSECLNETQDEFVVYSNSFESAKDTTGWLGYMEFNSEASPDGGSQSVYISGGCIWPHAWYVLPASENNGYYVIRCWGKNLDIGGLAGIRVENNYFNEVLISIHEKEWTYYESSDTLFCPSGKSITLFLGAGGIVPSAMLIDQIEIVKIAGSSSTTNINDGAEQISSFELYQNYPNPFNPVTKIKYTIPSDEVSSVKLVQLKVYDILGNIIATLVDDEKSPGIYETIFNGSNLSSGVYFYILKIDEKSRHRKMCLIK